MKRIAYFILASLILVSCATAVHKEIFKKHTVYNVKEFYVPRNVLYNAVLKVVCAQNFIIEKDEEDQGFILAKRSFQKGRKTIMLLLQAKMTSEEQDKSNLYINLLQTTERYYVADHTRFFLWIVPFPGGGGKEARSIKEEEKIIEDKGFYRDFFSAVEEQIKGMVSKIEAQMKDMVLKEEGTQGTEASEPKTQPKEEK